MGIDFFSTPMGKKFFTTDMPRLVKALERIAIGIEKSNGTTRIPDVMPMAKKPIIDEKDEIIKNVINDACIAENTPTALSRLVRLGFTKEILLVNGFEEDDIDDAFKNNNVED